VATVGSFALFYGLVFALAYVFPPPPGRLEFPGAGRVVWPLVGLLILATAVSSGGCGVSPCAAA